MFMNLSRKCGKNILNFDFLENKTVIFFLTPNVLEPFGLFSWYMYNGLNAPSIFLFSIEVLKNCAFLIVD